MDGPSKLTTPDLVVLSLLCEEPMHGYQINRELLDRDAKDWAGISRPQVYYSLKKLSARGFVEPAEDAGPLEGPERRLFRPTRAGRRALAKGLKAASWSTHRGIPPFLTWMALSAYASPQTLREQFQRRRIFLLKELERERETLKSLKTETGPMGKPARMMVELTILTFETELDWLDRAKSALVSGP